MKPRVLIADDHAIVAEGLRAVLEQIGCNVMGAFQDGRTLVSAVSDQSPDLVVLDISMPILNGLEAARQIRAENTRVKLIFLSMHVDSAYVREAFRVGANGFLLKNSAVSELGEAVREVLGGRKYISARVTSLSIDELLEGPASSTFGNELTER